MFLFFLLTIYSTISIDYTNYKISKLTNSDFNDTKNTPNLIKVNFFDVTIPSKSDINTIFYPLEFIENYSDMNILDKFETKLSPGEINFLFINKFLENYKKENLLVSVRDYYDNNAVDELFKAFSFKNANVTFIPSSLSYIIEESASLNNNFSKLVINMLGNKTVFNLYNVDYVDNKLNMIKLIKTDTLDFISDNTIEKIIYKNIYSTLMSQSNYTEEIKTFSNVEDIKNQIKDNLRSQVNKYEHLECFGQKNDGSVVLFSNIMFDLSNIREEINLISKEIKQKMEEFYSNFVLDENNEPLIFNSSVIITTLGSELVKDFFNINNLLNIQLQNIVRGGLKYFKIYDKIEDSRVIKKEILEKSKGFEFLNELKTYREYQRLKNVEIDFDELNEQDLNILKKEYITLAEKENFLIEFNRLKNKNEQIKKYKTIRDKKVKELGEYLTDLDNLLKKDNMLLTSGLKKKFDDMNKWYDENKDNKEILGNIFEEKRDNLEGLTEVYKKIVYRKKEEIKNEEKKKNIEETRTENEDGNLDEIKEEVEDKLKDDDFDENNVDSEEKVKENNDFKNDNDRQKQLDEENKKFMEVMQEEFKNEKFDKNKLEEVQKQLQDMMKDEKYNDLFKNENFDMFKEKKEEKDL